MDPGTGAGPRRASAGHRVGGGAALIAAIDKNISLELLSVRAGGDDRVDERSAIIDRFALKKLVAGEDGRKPLTEISDIVLILVCLSGIEVVRAVVGLIGDAVSIRIGWSAIFAARHSGKRKKNAEGIFRKESKEMVAADNG